MKNCFTVYYDWIFFQLCCTIAIFLLWSYRVTGLEWKWFIPVRATSCRLLLSSSILSAGSCTTTACYDRRSSSQCCLRPRKKGPISIKKRRNISCTNPMDSSSDNYSNNLLAAHPCVTVTRFYDEISEKQIATFTYIFLIIVLMAVS